MNTTAATTYPAWQATIRAAQAIVDRENQQRDEIEQQKLREERRERGKELQRALSYFGIETPELDNNRYEADGIVFWLGSRSTYRKELIDEGDNYVAFTLYVSHVQLPDFEDWNFIAQEVSVHHFNSTPSWVKEQSSLARAIDDLKAQSAAGMQVYQARQAQANEQAEQQDIAEEHRVAHDWLDLLCNRIRLGMQLDAGDRLVLALVNWMRLNKIDSERFEYEDED